MRRPLLAIAFALLLGACSASADTQAAEDGVARFHEALDRGKFNVIYAGSGQDLKEVTSQQDFTNLLSAIHRKLGRFRSGKTIGWNVNYRTGGNFVTLNREAQFERGPAKEQFIFRLSGDRAILVGYHINSNTLITS